MYLCATTATGDVYFYTKPVPSNNFRKSCKSTRSDNYLCETLIKRSVHKGDINAIANCSKYVACGGLEGLVSFWNSSTGAFRNFVEIVPKT